MTRRAGEPMANPNIIEQIEKVTLRMVMPAIYDFNPAPAERAFTVPL